MNKSVQPGIIFLFLLLFIYINLNAQNWQRVPEIPADYVNAIIDYNGILYAASDTAVYISFNNGVNWAPTPEQPHSNFLNTLFGYKGTVYAGTRMDGIFQTRDSGKTWQEINSGLTGSRYIAEFAARGDSLYAGTDGDGIFVLNLKNPISWKSFNDGLFQYGTTSIINSGNTLIAGAGQYVFVRPQGAAEWVYTAVDSVTSPIPIKLFLKDSVIYLGTNHGVFKGRADATGWQKADITQFPNRNIVAFTSSGSRVFAGLIYLSDHWIFSTDNNGASWNIHAHEFAIVLNLLASHERLWACRTDGLWWFDLSASTGAGKPGNNSPYDFALHQNYPNPFNPVTTIGFSLPHSALVSLKVYDILGRHVATLAEKQMPSGIHNIKFDGSSLASGVYLYRLTAGEFVQTRKLILQK